MKRCMCDLAETTDLIKKGKKLFLAGDENALSKLPKGEWVGGTIPYFMSDEGGLVNKEKVYVTELPEEVLSIKVKEYSVSQLPNIGDDYAANGFSLIIIPAMTDAHHAFARDISTYPNIFSKPLIGWISGVYLDEINTASPKVFNGISNSKKNDVALVMHCELKEGYGALVDIVNLFDQGDGDTITFPEPGFTASDCFINGEKANFSKYISKNNIDMQLPLVANYGGAKINVSFQSVDEKKGEVVFYAPVFELVEYKLAKPVQNYEKDFSEAVKDRTEQPAFSCNCILNFLYANLEGKKTGNITGPITYGEIAYMLLNQTMVYLDIVKK